MINSESSAESTSSESPSLACKKSLKKLPKWYLQTIKDAGQGTNILETSVGALWSSRVKNLIHRFEYNLAANNAYTYSEK